MIVNDAEIELFMFVADFKLIFISLALVMMFLAFFFQDTTELTIHVHSSDIHQWSWVLIVTSCQANASLTACLALITMMHAEAEC